MTVRIKRADGTEEDMTVGIETVLSAKNGSITWVWTPAPTLYTGDTVYFNLDGNFHPILNA